MDTATRFMQGTMLNEECESMGVSEGVNCSNICIETSLFSRQAPMNGQSLGWRQEVGKQHALRYGIRDDPTHNPSAFLLSLRMTRGSGIVNEPCSNHHVPRRVTGSQPVDNLDMKADDGGHS